MENLNSLIALIISDILLFVLFFKILFNKKEKNQLQNSFLYMIGAFLIWINPLILQILYQNTNIDPFFFEQLCGIGLIFMPITFIYMVAVFTNTKVRIKIIHLLLLVIPIITIILLLTNQKYHLFVISYSTNVSEIIYAPFYYLFVVYTYLLIIVGVIRLISYSLKNSGFFSKQSILLIVGIGIPLIINILTTTNTIEATVYSTPISFSIMVILYVLAISKFKFLSSTPIALQKIVDKISDSYIVLDENYNITDFNETFLHTFHTNADYIRSKNLFKLSEEDNNIKVQKTFEETLKKLQTSTETFQFEDKVPEIEKTFTIEMNNIYSKNNFLGILVLFKDITQHKQDIQTIQNNQDILIEQERLASLGQMIGGIAHNLKTPIFSVAGGLEGLSDLINEFDLSLDNDSVTNDDMHEIASDMRQWIEKLRGHISYMSDVITTVKGQAVTLSESESMDFSITELFKRVDILMKHEVKNALATLEIKNNVGDAELLSGNINSLVQIINNIISNAIEAYGNDFTDKKIELLAQKKASNIIISIKDYGPGISEMAQQKLFKEMITTKGKNGTGLGMFMSYSNIKVHFNGNLTYETHIGKGTTFYITIPINLNS